MFIKNISQIILTIVIIAASSQLSFAQGKTKLVNLLIEATIVHFPSAQIRRPLQDMEENFTKSLKVELLQTYTEAIEADKELNARQKANMIEHLPELTDDLSRRFSAKLLIAFSNNLMLGDCLRESYQKLSVADLNKTLAFLKTPAGKSFIKFLGELSVSVFEKTDNKPDTPKKYETKIERFGKTAAGEKFTKAFAGDTIKLFYEKTNAFLKNYSNNLDKDQFEAVVAEFKRKYAK